jgi:hypothetical protein
MLLVAVLAASLAGEPKSAPEINCEQVREFVAANGRASAFAWALRNGMTLDQIRKAAKCLH